MFYTRNFAPFSFPYFYRYLLHNSNLVRTMLIYYFQVHFKAKRKAVKIKSCTRVTTKNCFVPFLSGFNSGSNDSRGEFLSKKKKTFQFHNRKKAQTDSVTSKSTRVVRLAMINCSQSKLNHQINYRFRHLTRGYAKGSVNEYVCQCLTLVLCLNCKAFVSRIK